MARPTSSIWACDPFARFSLTFPDHLTGLIMSTYFGGRAEVRCRREVRQVLYCDFLSMYPTVCTLMRLWRFVIAQGMDWTTSTDRVRSLLETVSLDDLKRPEFWPLLTTIVRVAPQADIFPVRTKYDGQSQTIGLNHLTSDKPLWFTLADVIASKLLSGRVPKIIEAITFSPKEPQSGLRAVKIAGNPDYQVDPANDDFFKRLIDLRTTVKARLKNATALNRDALDSEQQALKILANSTSYGIFVEINVADLDASEKLICYGPDGEGFSVDSDEDGGARQILPSVAGDVDHRGGAIDARDCRAAVRRERPRLGLLRHRQHGDRQARWDGPSRVS